MLEDVRFAEVVKRKGLAVQVRPAQWAFRVRLYRSLGEIINGYTKGIRGLGRNPLAGFGAALFLFVCALLPFVLAVSLTVGTVLLWLEGDLCSHIDLVMGSGFTSNFAFRYRQELRDGRDGRFAFCHPLANMLVIWILLEIDDKSLCNGRGVLLSMEKAE